jgi:hypothetical protein
MDVGDIAFLSFPFLFISTTFLCHPPLFFVPNQNNFMFIHVATLALGLQPKQGFARVQAKNEA